MFVAVVDREIQLLGCFPANNAQSQYFYKLTCMGATNRDKLEWIHTGKDKPDINHII
jgi:hypothetical protein